MDDPYRAALALAAMRRPDHRTTTPGHPTPAADPTAAPPTATQATATHPSRRTATGAAATRPATRPAAGYPTDVSSNGARPAVPDAPADDVTDPLLWRDAQHVLHTHADTGGRCRQCGQPWPCPASEAARRADTLAHRPRPATDAAEAAALHRDAGHDPDIGRHDGALYPRRVLPPGTVRDESGGSPRTRYVGWWG